MTFGVEAGRAFLVARSDSPKGIQTKGGAMGICSGGCTVGIATPTSFHGSIMFFSHVLLIPCQGRFIWPFAVAELGWRYLRINFSERLGHPLRNPFQTALSRVEVLGLHNNWCANFTPFALVFMECEKLAIFMSGCMSGGACGAGSTTGADRGRADRMSQPLMDRVHRLVDLSL